MTGSALVVY